MKRFSIEYSPAWEKGPMTFWVHRPCDVDEPQSAPLVPAPAPIPGKGFASYRVEFDGFTFVFASIDEIRACITVLERRNLPTSRRLSSAQGSRPGPNSHWLSRLPARVKAWRYREPAVAYLREILDALEEPA